MLIIEKTDMWGFDHAIRGMRNPLNSWDKSDSYSPRYEDETFEIGENDFKLMLSLVKAGSSHRKFMRQIFVSLDIIAPLYWWKEFDTYKVGTVANSCSTMHTITKEPFMLKDFSYHKLDRLAMQALNNTINVLNIYREQYEEHKEKADWWQIIQLLPASYNQRRTITLSYENLLNIYMQRHDHKLDEWHVLCSWIESLPCMKEFLKEIYHV